MVSGYRILANGIVLLHFAFVLFVMFGGFLLFWKRRLALVHLPAVLWAAVVEFFGWPCPLTPLENMLRARGGGAVYQTGFLEHYIMPLLYPEFLGRELQIVLGTGCLALNSIIYWIYWQVRRKNKKEE